MDDQTGDLRPVELLQQLGLKEYEAKSFVALSRVESGTAKDVSALSEVPRTRVYDAVRVLESKGLVEVQHSSPKEYRAVSVDEAIETLQYEYQARFDSLREELENLDTATLEGGEEITHEVWTLQGEAAISSRAIGRIDEAEDEIFFIVGDGWFLSEEVAAALERARERGVEVYVGTPDGQVAAEVAELRPAVAALGWGLDSMSVSELADDDTEIGRVLLVDRSTLLVSTYHGDPDGEDIEEVGVFGTGFHNGVVTIVRRILAAGFGNREGEGHRPDDE